MLDVLLPLEPGSLALLDLDENGLVEIVRDLRSSSHSRVPDDFATLPIGLGSRECRRYFVDAPPFDYIIDLAAMKHVRSERDVYSLARMIDTNVLSLNDLLRALPYRCRNVFSVSSDKAVRPANLMGASKRIMEDVLLYHSERQAVSTARFANVAFSTGSLPAGFLMRLQKRQPLAAPRDIERYFLSHEEAGQLCLISAVLGGNREVHVPRLESLQGTSMVDLAERLLGRCGYTPHLCASEHEARARIDELLARKEWPCCFTDSDMTGEKPVEELYTEQDVVDSERYEQVGVLERSMDELDREGLEEFLAFAARAPGDRGVDKEAYVREVQKLVPSLRHLELKRSLEEKM